MDQQLIGNGSAMGQQWVSNGSAMDQQRISNESAMDQQWISNGSAMAMDQQCVSNGSAMDQQWVSNASAMRQQWISNASAMDQQCISNGSAMDQQCVSNGSAMNKNYLKSVQGASATRGTRHVAPPHAASTARPHLQAKCPPSPPPHSPLVCVECVCCQRFQASRSPVSYWHRCCHLHGTRVGYPKGVSWEGYLYTRLIDGASKRSTLSFTIAQPIATIRGSPHPQHVHFLVPLSFCSLTPHTLLPCPALSCPPPTHSSTNPAAVPPAP